MDASVLYKKFENLPDHLKMQVSDFIDFLAKRKNNEFANIPPKPKFGSAKGKFKIKTGFDEPLEDFKEYMQ